MKAKLGMGLLSYRLCCLFTRTLLVAGFLLGATGAFAQMPPDINDILLSSWTFNDSTWYSDWGYAPLTYTNLSNPTNWDGNDLQVDSTNAAFLQYNIVEADDTTNLTFDAGTIEFWFRPDWTSGVGPGDWGRLIEVGEYVTNAPSSWWSLYFTDDGTSLNFSSSVGTNVVFTNYLSAPISWSSGTWYFVALAYDQSATKLYINGQLATSGSGVQYTPSATALTNGFFVGSDDTGTAQMRGQMDDLATWNFAMSAANIAYAYQEGTNYMAGGDTGTTNTPSYSYDFGTNLNFAQMTFSDGMLEVGITNAQLGTLYEIQSRTNLSVGDWTTEAFLDSSELTNWLAASVPSRTNNTLFLRIRSWQDSTGTDIPDWWWLKYFGQITNVDAYAEDPAGDGFNNLQKFQLGLNPNLYFTSNAPAEFFGCLDPSGTNVVLGWSNAPGPVLNYVIDRGIYNTNTGDYDYTQFTVSSNAAFFQDIGVVSNANAQLDIYSLHAVYPGGATSGTNSWYINWYSNIGYLGLPYGPPLPSNVYVQADASGTNVLLSWMPVDGMATNYIIQRGVYDTNTYTFNYSTIATLDTNTTSYEDVGAIGSDNDWNNLYKIMAVYPGNGWSSSEPSTYYSGKPASIGASTNGPAAPGDFFGYTDSTGTNIYLSWTASPGSVTGYLIYGGVFNYNTYLYAYHQVASVSSGTTSYEDMGAVDGSGYPVYDSYFIVAVYADGSLSQSAQWYPSSGAPAPSVLDAYLDETGTNVLLNWTAAPGSVTGYIISQSLDNSSYFSQVAQVGSSTFSYQHTDGAPSYENVDAMQYQVQATYGNGGLSGPITAYVSHTPPAPTDVAVTVANNGADATVTWTPSLGDVSSYVVLRGTYNSATGGYDYTQIGDVSSSTTSFTDTGAITGTGNNNKIYAVKAVYSNGTISQLISQPLYAPQTITNNLSVSAQLVRNETGRWQLMFAGIPTNVTRVQVYIAHYYFESDGYWGNITDPTEYFGNQDLVASVAVSNLVNGVYVIPDQIATNEIGDNYEGRLVGVQAIGSGDRLGQMAFAGFFPYDAPCFIDGREHLKQNLLFQLRAATISQPKSISYDHVWFDPFYTSLTIPTDTNYVESSFFHWAAMFKSYDNTSPEYVEMDDLWPITANYKYHQSLYDTNYSGPSEFVWPTNLVSVPASAVLGIGDPYWVSQFSMSAFDPGNGSLVYSFTSTNLDDVGAYTNGGNLYLQSGINNLYGLPFAAALVDTPVYRDNLLGQYGLGTLTTLSPGGSVSGANVSVFYSQTDDPNLQLDNYYFTTVNTPGTALPGDSTPVQSNPLPVLTGFANTNQTGLLVASVGNPTVIGSWAKFGLQNGSSTKFAYLGQYFETNAFKLDGSGNVTANTTGVVSPYGNFFPTEPGAVALITQPDIDTGAQGTGVVSVISLNVDANHDGTMDFHYNSPDSVSESKPFRFWVNDDQDVGDYGGNYGIPGQVFGQADATADAGLYNYSNPNPNEPTWRPFYRVHGRRDLVDFFPVYINIGSLFQSNALSAGINYADTNWQFALSQADSALRFVYTDLTPTNYMNFLWDTNESGTLADATALPVVNINNYPTPLSQSFIANIVTNNGGILLVDAAASTTQPLVLTIYHGTNQIAQTSLYLSISGVEQMFRSKTMMLNPHSGEVADRLADADVTNEPDTTDKNFVFLHGYNVLPNEARGVAADVFKRMYWSGSHAKFWAVTWEGADSKIGSLLTPNYHTNVVNAFNTAPLLANFIATLTNSGPVVVAAHSLGNMVVLSAISDWDAPISQYFMMDAAVPLEAIDPTATTNMMIFSTWTAYSNRLFASDWYQLFPTNDARSTLSWNNRLGNLRNVDVYNFYSSGEEVLRTYIGDPPTNVLTMAGTQIFNNVWNGVPFGTGTWYWQEKGKGTCTQDWFLGSSHGGWKFNSYYDRDNFGNHMLPEDTAQVSDSNLQTNAFFDWGTFNSDLSIELTSGSTYAATNRNRILADAIPAMSLVLGANPVPTVGIVVQNTDMMILENGWAPGRTGNEAGKWHHSDFQQMAYPFTYNLYNQFVTTGNLK